MESIDWSEVGAFLSGMASILGAVFVVRGIRRRMRRECEERLEIFRQGIEEGRRK